MQSLIIELRPESPKKEKIVVKGIEVYIAEETSIYISATGKTLTEAEYIEYSREGVIKRVATLGDLYNIWLDRERRKKFLEELKRESIIPELLASILKAPDADTFDVIAHVAFGAPLLTRDERARAFLNKKRQLIDALGGKARDVILALLDKYRIGGIEQITDAKVFRLPPFDKMGYLRGVAEIFGGFDKLKEAIDMLERGLYEV
jgi:type I restriction enzyme R subunit